MSNPAPMPAHTAIPLADGRILKPNGTLPAGRSSTGGYRWISDDGLIVAASHDDYFGAGKILHVSVSYGGEKPLTDADLKTVNRAFFTGVDTLISYPLPGHTKATHIREVPPSLGREKMEQLESMSQGLMQKMYEGGLEENLAATANQPSAQPRSWWRRLLGR